MKETLKDILIEINNWLKYAEAKNAALLAFDGAACFALLQALEKKPALSIFWLIYIVTCITFLMSSLILSLLSFIPRLKPPWTSFATINTDSDNLLYFGDICKYTPNSYLQALSNIMGKKSTDQIELQYANQIVTNSKIAFIKFQQFNIALWFAVSAILTPLGAILISKIRK